MDFKNTIIILTSNLGSQFLLDGINPDGSISREATEQVQQLLRRSFRPEFLNRLDEIVFYKPLTKDNIGKIIDLQIEALNQRLEDKQMHVTVSTEAKQFIIERRLRPAVRCPAAAPLCPAYGRDAHCPPHHRRRYPAGCAASRQRPKRRIGRRSLIILPKAQTDCLTSRGSPFLAVV